MHLDSTGLALEETFQAWALSETSIHKFLALEVDMVVLLKEQSKLGDMLARIIVSLRELRLSRLEQELQA